MGLVHLVHLQPVGDDPVLAALPAGPLLGHPARAGGGRLLPGELDAQGIPDINIVEKGNLYFI